jgi:hypothetical protein
MLEYLATILGMQQTDGFISSAEAAEKKPKQVQTAPPPKEQLCSYKDLIKIRECLEAKFKDDRETHPEMWDKDWVNKP